MKATVKWQNGLNFIGKSDTGHEMTLSGNGEFLSPMEAVLQSMGGCSSIDVVLILQKGRVSLRAGGVQKYISLMRYVNPPRSL